MSNSELESWKQLRLTWISGLIVLGLVWGATQVLPAYWEYTNRTQAIACLNQRLMDATVLVMRYLKLEEHKK
jgi:hypothetical protein